ncbi:spermidine synthase [Humidisolicoccus flavus]|uniref:spermidine synthase n=1 Tax=Humidisolicoccus flavus TaxID=3111414 RepID=UPI003D30152B
MLAEMRYSGDGGFQLVVDGTPQSHVDPERPDFLLYEYVRRIGHVIDALPNGPLTAVHLGAGAMTLPRYVEHTRPGSRQQVLELEPGLVELVRSVAPLPKRASIRLRYGDARETLGKLPNGLLGTVDLVIVDVFSGARTPAHVTSIEFHTLLAGLPSANGIIAINIADGKGLQFARSQLATLKVVHPHVAAIADTGLLKGRRFGNLVAIASQQPLPSEALPAILARDAFPAKLIIGDELDRLISGAAPVLDQSAVPSPPPARSVFQVPRG